MDPDRVIIFDTTLRDGEQSPGISLNTTEKLEIAHQLARLGVDVIEAGFPIASPGDFEAVQAIAREVARTGDRRASRELMRPTSSVPPMRYATRSDLGSTRSSRRRTSTSSTSCSRRARTSRAARARRWRTRSRSSTTSSSRRWTRRAPTSSSPPRWCRSRSTRARRRSTSRTPSATRRPASTRRSWAGSTSWSRRLRGVVLSVHCHDDLGLAVANSLAGVQAGARQVECAINGIGERAGNASLEEIVMLLHTRAADLGFATGVDHARDRAHEPDGLAAHRLPRAAEQGDRRAATRSRTSPASTRTACSRTARPTRSWTPPRSGWRATTSCSASTPAGTRCKSALQELGFQVDGPGAQHGVQALQGDRRPQEAVTAMDLEALVTDELRDELAPTRSSGSTSTSPTAGRRRSYTLEWFDVDVSNRRPPHARVSRADARRRGGPRRLHRRRPGRRDLPRDQRGDASARRGCASSASTRSPAARTRSARRASCSSSPASPPPGQGVSTDIIEAAALAYVRALSNAERKVVAARRARPPAPELAPTP